MEKKRNINLDLMKVIASIAIVCIHVTDMSNLPINARGVIYAMSSFAVPVFFYINGFCSDTSKNIYISTIRYSLMYIIPLLIYSFIFYKNIPIGNFMDFMTFCLNPNCIARHFWFLLALILGRIFYTVVTDKYLRIFTSIAIFLIGLIYEPFHFSNNPLLPLLYPHILAIPMIGVGMLILKFQNKILKYSNVAIVIFILSFIGIIMESSLFAIYNRFSLYYYFTYPLSISIIIIVLSLNVKNYLLIKISTIGRNYSQFIYIYHLMIITFIFNIIIHPT